MIRLFAHHVPTVAFSGSAGELTEITVGAPFTLELSLPDEGVSTFVGINICTETTVAGKSVLTPINPGDATIQGQALPDHHVPLQGGAGAPPVQRLCEITSHSLSGQWLCFTATREDTGAVDTSKMRVA